MIDLTRLLDALAQRRPVFHSLDDLRTALGELVRAEHPTAQVRLRHRPHPDSPRFDVWVVSEGGATAIEVIYRTRAVSVTVGGERFDLRTHGAEDLGRYDLVRDLVRVEQAVVAGYARAGYALLLTNDHLYWQEPTHRRASIDAAFRLHDGTALDGERRWGPGAGAGTTKGRSAPLVLRGRYRPEWRDYSVVDETKGGTFRYLALRVEGG